MDLDELRARARQRQRRLFVWGLAWALIVVAGALVVGISVVDNSSQDLPVWGAVALFGFPILLIAITFGVLIALHRRGASWLRQSALLGADRTTRRRVGRDVRHGVVPSEPLDRALAVDAARTVVAQRWLWILFAVNALMQLLMIAIAESDTLRFLYGGVAVLLGIVALLGRRQVSRARRLLDAAHRDDEASPPAKES